jgi:hypothetical protein
VSVGVEVRVGRGVSEGGIVGDSVGEAVRVTVAVSVGEGSGEAVQVGTMIGVGVTISPNPPQPMRKRANIDIPIKSLFVITSLPRAECYANEALAEKYSAFSLGDCFGRKSTALARTYSYL